MESADKLIAILFAMLIGAIVIVGVAQMQVKDCAPRLASDDYAGYAHFTGVDGRLYEFPKGCER